MKILWIVNLIPANLSSSLGVSTDVLGGWVESMAGVLKKNPEIELSIACKSENGECFDEIVNGVRYISIVYTQSTPINDIENRISDIIKNVNPDLVHIEGTEFLHALAAMNVCEELKLKSVTSMQGILDGYYNYQCGLLQIDDLLFSKDNFMSGLLLHLRKTRWYKKRLAHEKQVIEKSRNILGRTTWDRAHSYTLNPNARYYTCNRNLRVPFYAHEWGCRRPNGCCPR